MLLVAAALGRFLPVRLAAVWLGLLGAASMWFDYRSFAAIAFLLAAYVWVRAARPRQSLARGGRFLGLLAAGAVAGVLVLGMLSLTDSEYSAQRRAQSNAGRSAAFEVGLIAIARSPLIGYGSWTENRELAELFMARYQEKRGIRDPNAHSGYYFAPHSQLLQSWVEGGVLGAAFFLYLGYRLLRRAGWTVLARPVDMLTPLVLYLLVSCAWHLVMSPFTAPHRIHIALGAAILVLVESELRAARLETGRRAAPGSRAAGSPIPNRELPVTHGRGGPA
jgi:O-antigen ligase